MAGVDTQNQFPNSMMANAVKLGQSRFQSQDVPSIAMGQQANVPIAAATALTIPTVIGPPDNSSLQPTYAVVTAIGGALYYTIDGTVPSATNNAGQVAAGASVPFYGLGLLQALKFIGTNMSVGYYR
ncbi:MAG: hypothetical protein AAGL98_00205 [Planctomycetota bacterium]